MKSDAPLSSKRRDLLLRGGNIIAVGALLETLGPLARAADVKPIKVGYLYAASRDDYGFNQSFAVTARKMAKMPGVTVIEQERVPETAQCERVMESMIQVDGCKGIMATSFGYWPFVLKLAAKYPDVLFIHGGALWKEGDPKNAIGYRGYMEEPHYLCGIAAGRMTKTGKLGFIGSKPLYFIFNNCNGFVLGARSVRPDATCRVVITGDWDNPVKEAQAVNALADQGIDVIIADVDGPKVSMETAERRGIYSCGYHTDLSALAPKGFLTGAEWDWSKADDFIHAWQTGGTYPNLLRGGFKQGMVAISPFGKSVPDNVRQEVLKAKQGFIDDTLKLYKGPLKDNEGKQVLAAGQVISNTDNDFKVNVKWLVEGAIGETGLK
ncbi:MAG TPA: BMP family ABC transporter substrate-binding protein [Casimicrobiaceae bacterium]|nr:BMP family ABC transporter substrate-binding protein [Casimicrobiaceae bacterium]